MYHLPALEFLPWAASPSTETRTLRYAASAPGTTTLVSTRRARRPRRTGTSSRSTIGPARRAARACAGRPSGGDAAAARLTITGLIELFLHHAKVEYARRRYPGQ